MAEPEIVVVDTSDAEIGTMPIGDAIARGAIRRVAKVIPCDGARVLLQERAADLEISPSLWDLTGGHVDAGELYAETAVRECEEELGVTPRNLEVCAYAYIEEHDTEAAVTLPSYNTVYLATIDETPNADADEVAAVRWWDMAELSTAIANEPSAFAESLRRLWPLCAMHGSDV